MGMTRYAILLVALLFATPAGAQKVNSEGGPAVRGTDVVAYFIDGKAVPGSPQFSHRWNGADWHFASAANRDAFAADPAKYAPQYGGYCAFAVSSNYVYDADPEIWKIVDGKLYLNYNRIARFRWEQDIPGRIKKADEYWPKLHK